MIKPDILVEVGPARNMAAMLGPDNGTVGDRDTAGGLMGPGSGAPALGGVMNAPVIEAVVPEVDLDVSRHFLRRLDPEAQVFCFQTFLEKGNDHLIGSGLWGKNPTLHPSATHYPMHRHTTLDDIAATLAAINKDCGGIYVVVNKTDGNGRTVGNITGVRALFVDLDGAPLEPVLAAMPAPHLVIESSKGRFQAFWLVADCPLDQFKPLQQRLAAKFAGDASVCDLSRVMRLPGFLHRKYGGAFMSRIVHECNSPRYSVEEIVAGLDLNMSAAPVVAASAAAKAIAPAPGAVPAKSKTPRKAHGYFGLVNAAAMANLAGWVPELFAEATAYQGGYRVASADLCRDLEEDISIHPDGIVDFGVHDQGDARQGKRSPIDLVVEWSEQQLGRVMTVAMAADWLCDVLGLDPAELRGRATTQMFNDAESERESGEDPTAERDDGPFYLDGDGVWLRGFDSKGKAKPPLFVCSPLRVKAKTRTTVGDEWGRLLEWPDDDGKLHHWPLPMELLQGDTADARRELARSGLRISPGGRARDALIAYMLPLTEN